MSIMFRKPRTVKPTKVRARKPRIEFGLGVDPDVTVIRQWTARDVEFFILEDTMFHLREGDPFGLHRYTLVVVKGEKRIARRGWDTPDQCEYHAREIAEFLGVAVPPAWTGWHKPDAIEPEPELTLSGSWAMRGEYDEYGAMPRTRPGARMVPLTLAISAAELADELVASSLIGHLP